MHSNSDMDQYSANERALRQRIKRDTIREALEAQETGNENQS